MSNAMETIVNTGTENVVETAVTEKTYTEAEVQEMLQKEGDRRVTAALKKQQEKDEKEKAEAEKMRDMDDSKKKEY